MSIKTKICGIRTPEALDAAIAGGADYIGLVFFAKSPRNISVADAARLAKAARGKAAIVALVVDADDAQLAEIAQHVRPDFLQLHGHESVARVQSIKRRAGASIIKAIAVETAADAGRSQDFAGVADMILFDAKPPKDAILPGGNGVAFDWRALESVRGKLDFMLSGGLTLDNVTEAIRATGARAVDVSSGVESAPGVKDAELIRRFLHAVKTAKQT
jgi:phosphoribosylanthranilate isomerase